jgi:hypothetical protein
MFSPQPIWVKLSNFPLELWLKVLKAIGDNIGSFTEMDDHFKRNSTRVMARILLELDLREGFQEDIKIEVGRRSYGHLAEDSLHKFSKREWRRKSNQGIDAMEINYVTLLKDMGEST